MFGQQASSATAPDDAESMIRTLTVFNSVVSVFRQSGSRSDAPTMTSIGDPGLSSCADADVTRLAGHCLLRKEVIVHVYIILLNTHLVPTSALSLRNSSRYKPKRELTISVCVFFVRNPLNHGILTCPMTFPTIFQGSWHKDPADSEHLRTLLRHPRDVLSNSTRRFQTRKDHQHGHHEYRRSA
jgi:hypothetical protein